MSIAVMDDQWATFNIREDLLKDIKVGEEITVRIPALDKETKMKVTSMKDKGRWNFEPLTASLYLNTVYGSEFWNFRDRMSLLAISSDFPSV